MISGSKISWVSPNPGSSDLYISDNPDSISNAKHSSKFFVTNTSIPQFDISSLKLATGKRYYWRIDLVNGATTLLGAVNTFINPTCSF
jgi:hypothetical protein